MPERLRENGMQLLQARFGIGDVYFCALSWGKLEVIEARSGSKRLPPRAHDGSVESC